MKYYIFYILYHLIFIIFTLFIIYIVFYFIQTKNTIHKNELEFEKIIKNGNSLDDKLDFELNRLELEK